MDRMNVCWAALAQAVIITAKRDLIKNNNYAKDAEMFFNSNWYDNLNALVALVNPPRIENTPSIHNEIH